MFGFCFGLRVNSFSDSTSPAVASFSLRHRSPFDYDGNANTASGNRSHCSEPNVSLDTSVRYLSWVPSQSL